MQLRRRQSPDSPPSAPQLDAATIRRVRFRVTRQGFDTDETCLFLADVADLVEGLEARVRELEAEVRAARAGGSGAP